MRNLCLTLLLLPTGLVGQSGGPLVALPHGFSVDPGTVLPGLTAGKMLFSNSGFDAYQPPTPPAGFVVPDFSTFLGGATVDVDALSIGMDWVVSTLTGIATVPPPRWAAVTASVTPGTSGAPGSLIAAEAAGVGGVAADTIAYVIPGSSLPPAIVGVPFRAQDAGELNPAFLTTTGNIDAHDIYIALLYLENPQIAALLPPPTVYFSVTDATKASIPFGWTASPPLRSGATVFRTTWVPSTMSWTLPTVAYTPFDFGLTTAEDIDAIAIDLASGFALFSTNLLLPPPPTGPRDPLLFQVLGSGTNSIYRLPNGTPISSELGLGLGSDDIDGICALDPGSAASPSPINLPLMVGTPGPPLPLGTPTQLSASAWRVLDPVSNQEFATTWMTGWPPPGNPQVSLAISAASIGGPFGPYVFLDTFLRPDPTNQYEGHPHKTELVIPPSVSLSGQELWFLWGSIAQTGSFDTSLPIGLIL